MRTASATMTLQTASGQAPSVMSVPQPTEDQSVGLSALHTLVKYAAAHRMDIVMYLLVRASVRFQIVVSRAMYSSSWGSVLRAPTPKHTAHYVTKYAHV